MCPKRKRQVAGPCSTEQALKRHWKRQVPLASAREKCRLFANHMAGGMAPRSSSLPIVLGRSGFHR